MIRIYILAIKYFLQGNSWQRAMEYAKLITKTGWKYTKTGWKYRRWGNDTK